MGVLPLEFAPGVNRRTLALDGTETYDVLKAPAARAPISPSIVRRRNGEMARVPMTCRLDTADEVAVCNPVACCSVSAARIFWRRWNTTPRPLPPGTGTTP